MHITTNVVSSSEWLLFDANSPKFQLYHGENKLIINKTNALSLIFIVLAHWCNSPRVDMSLHSNTVFWFRANQSLLFLLKAACLVEKQQIPILVFGLIRTVLESTIYRTRGEHANHCATDAVAVSSNRARARCTRYNIYVSDLRQVGGFLWVLQFPPPIKLTAMILLK